MEAVRMNRPVSVNNGAAGLRAAPKSESGEDGFIRLLQEKRELAEPERAVKGQETKGREDRTQETQGAQRPKRPDQSQEAKEAEPEKTEGTADKAAEENDPNETNIVQQEQMMQAVIAQAALQAATVVVEVEASPAETVGGIEAESLAASLEYEGLGETSADEASMSMISVSEAAGQDEKAQAEDFLPGRADESVRTATKAENRMAENRAEEPRAEEAPGSKQPDSGQQAVTSAAPEGKTEEGQYDGAASAKETKESRAVDRQEKAEAQQEEVHAENEAPQAVYTSRESESGQQVSLRQKTEEIPLKTTEADLPQDLGKTLASRLIGNGKELTLDLEPANLGKLTIRLLYEGERAAVSIMASNPKTLELLSQRAGEIASILEEKTGQETLIYTHAPERQENQEQDMGQGKNDNRREPEEQRKGQETDRHQAESFAQQLRLGLV